MRIPTPIERALNDTGLPWHIEEGKRHHQIRLDGRMVGILPKGVGCSAAPRTVKNTVSQIKKAARGEKWSNR